LFLSDAYYDLYINITPLLTLCKNVKDYPYVKPIRSLCPDSSHRLTLITISIIVLSVLAITGGSKTTLRTQEGKEGVNQEVFFESVNSGDYTAVKRGDMFTKMSELQ